MQYIREVRQSAENGVAELRHSSKSGQKAVFHSENGIKNPPSVLGKAAEQIPRSKIIYCKD